MDVPSPWSARVVDRRLEPGAWAMRRADAVHDLSTVVTLLEERARWLHGRGITGQWPLPFPDSVVLADLATGHTWLTEADGEAVATVTLTWTDKHWDDAVGEAGYVHRLAVRPGHRGLGAALLAWAGDRVRAQGGRYLRLDCVVSNPALCAYYDDAGFRRRGTRTVRGFPGDERPDPPTALLQRYELDLGAPRCGPDEGRRGVGIGGGRRDCASVGCDGQRR